ncbi:MAG TPA: efflux RND transporter periplasmic adaptor subunit [Thermoanaerobaculia bacterium]|nr:efflux RND transporter periplasmic adaptor subunit [Thermoanaerobaculia bacterium]
MTRQITTTLLITLALFGCAKKEAAPAAATTTQAAPELPSDVTKVQAAATATTAPAETSTAPVAAADATGTIVATGEFVSPVRSELAVKMPGRVAKMYVDEGSRVSKGQPLLELETDYVRINLQRAEADTARAKAAEDDARRDLERKKELIGKDSIPRATYDRSEAGYQQAQAARASASAQASLYRQQLNDAVLRSPIDGVVAEKRTDVGARLGEASVAVVVVQTSPLKLRFRVPERYLAEVHKGQSVKASVDPYPGQAFEGKVTVVGGVIDPATRSLLVETEFANRDGKLKPGLFARVEMEPGK